MFYGNTVQDTRQMFFSSWQKYRQNQALFPVEQQIVDVILAHPEYHPLFDNPKAQNDQAYFPELGQSNPFLHLGLHLAIRDQINTDRPTGIAPLYKALLKKYRDALETEHRMIEPLAECLWQAQRSNKSPDEQAYLSALAKLLQL